MIKYIIDLLKKGIFDLLLDTNVHDEQLCLLPFMSLHFSPCKPKLLQWWDIPQACASPFLVCDTVRPPHTLDLTMRHMQRLQTHAHTDLHYVFCSEDHTLLHTQAPTYQQMFSNTVSDSMHLFDDVCGDEVPLAPALLLYTGLLHNHWLLASGSVSHQGLQSRCCVSFLMRCEPKTCCRTSVLMLLLMLSCKRE